MAKRSPQFGPTQKDIARALGLSQASVALALNPKSKARLTPETVALVEAKARELNYRPQRQARFLRSGRSHTIGVVFVSGAYHAPQERVKHLVRHALKAGYQLVAIDLEWFEFDLQAAREYLIAATVEGLILCNLASSAHAFWYEFAQERGVPIVFNMPSALEAPVDQGYSDIGGGFEQLSAHHLAHGSRRLELLLSFHDAVMDQRPDPVMLMRVQGFRRAITAAGGHVVADDAEAARLFDLPLCPRKRRGNGLEGRVSYPLRLPEFRDVLDMGFHQMSRLLEQPALLPESLLCSNDHIAVGAIAACSQHGVAIPEAIRISGADNAPFARYSQVPLSTIEQPAASMSQWGIERIVELIENPAERLRPRTQAFPCELVLRASTGGEAPAPSPKPRKPATRRRATASAFTVTELLVSLTIVGVLVALTLSAFQMVRAKGDATRCVANLRSAGQAMIVYFTDRNGRFFDNKNWFAYPSTKPGVNNGMREYFGIISDNYTIASDEFKHDSVLTCPTMKRLYPALYPQALNRGFAINYYLNNKDPSSKYDSGPSANRPRLSGAPQQMGRVPEMASMWILTEAAVNGGLLGSVNENTVTHANNFMPYPHSGKQNVFFLDGHIEQLSREEFRNPSNPRAFWGNLNLPETSQ